MPEATGVETYLAALPAESRAALEKLRRTIQSVAPEATETITYQMPTFKNHGRSLVSYAAFKDHCSLFPMSLAVIDAHRAELQPYLASKGTIHFHVDKPLPDSLVKKLVKARLQELDARGEGAGSR
jgi:uncharacterized protein YdhG (YjbR/CyaY superfamily)